LRLIEPIHIAIFRNSDQGAHLHAHDVEARQNSFDARKTLLRSNPSLYISRTRLSLRQLPLFATDGLVRRLANWAAKQFEKEAKAGTRQSLDTDERADVGSFVSGKGASRVKQAKVLRQADRVDPLTGLGRSKGYGFLELATHADALRVARWINANNQATKMLRQWWRDDLEAHIKRVEAGDEVEGTKDEKKTRLKRLQAKLEELEAEEERAKLKGDGAEKDRATRTIIVEFSIENAGEIHHVTFPFFLVIAETFFLLPQSLLSDVKKRRSVVARERDAQK
jgi:nucleolar protein 4